MMNSFYALGGGGPAKALLDTFADTISDPNVFDVVTVNQKMGGVYGKGDERTEEKTGSATQPARNAPLVDIKTVLKSNDFFSLEAVGAGGLRMKKSSEFVEARSRINQCPAAQNLLQYIVGQVQVDIDIDNSIGWAGQCDKA
ncbi:hypothetical protein SUNI508_12189 [Seiridium unicorne]|uniref:Uncharacterized protein n=1 Tax=Seiridium unicorne TaxID=138068 RepID=A0ABR2UF21_9PEZI